MAKKTTQFVLQSNNNIIGNLSKQKNENEFLTIIIFPETSC